MLPENDGGVEKAITSALRDSSRLQEAADSLIEYALDNGSTDNISLIIAEYPGA
jgi:serine/threonine protein phosphatase PrpC